MKKRIILFALFLLSFPLFANNLQKAEKLFTDGDFATALPQYQQLSVSAQGNTRLQAQLRAAACQYHLGEYLNAAKTMLSYPLPKDTLWAARFLLYRIQIAQQASWQYNSILQQREIDTPQAQQDPEQWTRAQWNQQISKDYETLWTLRKELIDVPTATETLILDTKETDLERIPTLFDFTVHNWLEYLDNQTPVTPLTARTYLNGQVAPHESAKEKMEKRAQILQTAYTMDGKNRQNAKIFWQTDYILLPFQHESDFVFTNKEKATEIALEQLNTLSGFQPQTSLLQKLKIYTSANTAYGRSYAAYQAAQLAYNQDKREQSLTLCKFAATLPRSYYTDRCEQLSTQITQPSFSFRSLPAALNPQTPLVPATANNVARVYARLYPTTMDELKQLPSPSYYRNTPWYFLARLNSDAVKQILESKKTFSSFSQAITYQKPYFEEKIQLALPPLQTGFYVLLASDSANFNPAENAVNGIILNSTDLALFTTAAIEDNPDVYTLTPQSSPLNRQPNVFRFYTLDLKTGQVAPYSTLQFAQNNHNVQKISTDSQGYATLSHPISSRNNNWKEFAVLAQKDGSSAYIPSVSFDFSFAEPVHLFVQTDRAIYRPGQKVNLSVQAFQNVVRGTEVLQNTPLKIEVRNANYDIFFTTTLTTNAMGTAQTQVTLPEDVRLGHFSITTYATINSSTYTGRHSFSVEEYKRPDYEITLNPLDKALAYNKATTVTGHAQYYSGAALQNAQINYTVTREEYTPPFYWWWYRPSSPREEIANGQTHTDREGNFHVTFTPKITRKDEQFALYRVKAEVLDESGRAIETTSSYKVSVQPYLFKATFAQGFYDANTVLDNFARLDLTNADGQSVSGKISVRVSQLSTTDGSNVKEEEVSWRVLSPSWEKWYQDAAVVKTVFTKEISFNKPGPQTLSLPALSEGVYRLTLKNNQATEQNLLFLVVKNGKTLSLPDVTIAQHNAYYPGETARILLGDSRLQENKWLEFYTQGEFLLAKKRLSGGLQVVEYTVQKTDRGGLALKWFGASNYQFHQGSTTLDVPFDNKEIVVSIDAPQTLLPGQKITWNIMAKNSANAPVNGQASLTVYDKSLDYYAKKENPFHLANLFPQTARVASSFYSPLRNATAIYFTKRTSYKWMDLLPLPVLNLSMRARFYKGGMRALGRAAAPLAMNKMAVMQTDEFAEAEVAMDTANYKAVEESATLAVKTAGAIDAEEKQSAEAPRTNFAETAYFNALLPVTNGKATARFTLPDSLTTWNVLGFVLTKQADFGSFTATSIARKDFMVRLSLPRFYREGDKGVFKVAVTNLSRQKLTVPVTLSVRKNNVPAHKDFGIHTLTQSISVSPQETSFASWDITAPYAPDVYQITASAKSFQTSDGEQKDFLVLPGTTRLLATTNHALKNGANTLTISELDNNPSAQAEIASLKLHPSLALSVLNSMPNLLLTPYNDLVSSLNRYVPLAVVHQFYTTYPQLKEAVKKLPKRTGLSASWNEKDPLRLTLLEQTPWTYQARGRQQNQANIINLFDDTVVSTRLQKEIDQIKKFQNNNGAFTWFQGGPDDLYLTLFALESFAQALHYKAAIPNQVAQRAFSYAAPQVENRLSKDKEGLEGTSSFALYAAYVLSSFPKEWPQYNRAQTYIKKWVDYADKNSRFMTPLGQIYAAAIYHRLGDDVKANSYLDKVLARMKQNELTGAYFAPEAQSWVWYNDTLTTQTVTLRTLLEIRPNSDKIDPMVQWLLFNRQVNEWSHSKGAAQTIFALLDVMQTKGALSSSSNYAVTWADTKAQLNFEPFDWTEDLQWTKQGVQITPAAYSATVTKQSKITDFASLSVVYRSATAKASPKGVINVSRDYFVRFTENGVQKLRPVTDLSQITVGDEIEVQLTLTTDSAFEYVLLEDPKPAGFESADLTSAWTWNPVSMYREIRDGQTRFFINRVPAGKMTLRYVLRPTLPGEVHLLPAQAQSMYAPEYGAHSESRVLKIAR